MTEGDVPERGSSPSFIVFSDDWDGHPSSCQHLFKQIGMSHRVLWVNTIGMRNPRFTWIDFRKALTKISRMFTRMTPLGDASSGSPMVDVCQPLMLPFSAIGLIRQFNRRSVVAAVKERSRAFALERPVIVATVPNACDYVESFDCSHVVYYCVDDFSQWPGLQHDLVREMEGRLIIQADVLIATSEKLYRRLAAAGKPVHLLSHGVDLALFGRSIPEEHQCLNGIPHPRAGYFGLFDERCDQRLLAELASRMPRFSFVLTGPVAVDVSGLSANPNIHFTGPLPYDELPRLIAGLDALILPYAVSDFTATISPLKLKEYMATGLPVVSNPIAEARAMHAYVTIAETLDDWVDALEGALVQNKDERRLRMADVLCHETWSAKADTFMSLSGS